MCGDKKELLDVPRLTGRGQLHPLSGPALVDGPGTRSVTSDEIDREQKAFDERWKKLRRKYDL